MFKRKGFTLLELIVVIVILGLLAALAIPTFKSVIAKSQDQTTLTSLQSIGRNVQALAAISGDESWSESVEEDNVQTAIGEAKKTANEGEEASAAVTVVNYHVITTGTHDGELLLSLRSDSGNAAVVLLPEIGENGMESAIATPGVSPIEAVTGANTGGGGGGVVLPPETAAPGTGQAPDGTPDFVATFDLTPIDDEDLTPNPEPNVVSLGFAGAVDVTVDWGDGTPKETFTSGGPRHTYTEIGTYQVEVDGTFETLTYSQNSGYNLKSVDKWTATGTTGLPMAFAGTQKLEYVATPPATVTDLTRTFMSSNFNAPIDQWDVSNVKKMDYLFVISKFNQPLNRWDVSNVESMSNMFNNTTFNHPLNNWNTSGVKDMSMMFAGNKNFNQDISTWDVSEVTNMTRLFNSAPGFNQNLSGWDVSAVTSYADYDNGASAWVNEFKPSFNN